MFTSLGTRDSTPRLEDDPPRSVDPITAMMCLEKMCYGKDEEAMEDEEDEAMEDAVGKKAGTAGVSKKTP